ncbi:hypothetical protein F4680DRAFT_217628 [Xylaria scruposa]|nr:hypothetical protein F4680DRAFT_217628 [Xylaria scruposa]
MFCHVRLQRRPLDIFPRTAKGKDKYVFVVPLALTLCAESHGCSTSLFVLYEIMVLSILNFRADEHVEGVIEKDFATDLDSIRHLVEQLFASFQSKIQNVNATNCNGAATKQHYQSPGSFNNDPPTCVENGDQHNDFEHAISTKDIKGSLST